MHHPINAAFAKHSGMLPRPMKRHHHILDITLPTPAAVGVRPDPVRTGDSLPVFTAISVQVFKWRATENVLGTADFTRVDFVKSSASFFLNRTRDSHWPYGEAAKISGAFREIQPGGERSATGTAAHHH